MFYHNKVNLCKLRWIIFCVTLQFSIGCNLLRCNKHLVKSSICHFFKSFYIFNSKLNTFIINLCHKHTPHIHKWTFETITIYGQLWHPVLTYKSTFVQQFHPKHVIRTQYMIPPTLKENKPIFKNFVRKTLTKFFL